LHGYSTTAARIRWVELVETEATIYLKI
jgi:hypothetical protein